MVRTISNSHFLLYLIRCRLQSASLLKVSSALRSSKKRFIQFKPNESSRDPWSFSLISNSKCMNALNFFEPMTFFQVLSYHGVIQRPIFSPLPVKFVQYFNFSSPLILPVLRIYVEFVKFTSSMACSAPNLNMPVKWPRPFQNDSSVKPGWFRTVRFEILMKK